MFLLLLWLHVAKAKCKEDCSKVGQEEDQREAGHKHLPGRTHHARPRRAQGSRERLYVPQGTCYVKMMIIIFMIRERRRRRRRRMHVIFVSYFIFVWHGSMVN